jgi:NADPH:quinone reductase-like Zn-dependent oxidoreductase
MPIFAQSFLHGDHDPDYQKQGLGGGLDGVLAEYFICDEVSQLQRYSRILAHPSHLQSGLVHIPESLNYVEASTLVVAALTSWHSLYAHPGAILLPGQTVLVLGTGGVSIFAAQIALAAGCKVIATSSSDEKLARAKALGVQGGVNYRTHKEWHEEVLKLNGGRGVDHVIEGQFGRFSHSALGADRFGCLALQSEVRALFSAPFDQLVPVETSGSSGRSLLLLSVELGLSERELTFFRASSPLQLHERL